MHRFADRSAAGRQLAAHLGGLGEQDLVVLGLPRGGVPVAFEVAAALQAPLDVIVVRKLGLPGQPVLAMGAIGEDGVRVLDLDVLRHGRVSDAQFQRVQDHEQAMLDRRVAQLRRGRSRVSLNGQVAVIVDDGLATGSTARAACLVARRLGAARIVLAVPVAPVDALSRLPEAEEVVCVAAPTRFAAVGQHYRDFSATSDDTVIFLLDAADRRWRSE